MRVGQRCDEGGAEMVGGAEGICWLLSRVRCLILRVQGGPHRGPFELSQQSLVSPLPFW